MRACLQNIEIMRYMGNGQAIEECHVKPDWLLIYAKSNDNELILVRTGSHSELY
ncbi:MAG: type II toxin-antitoxin system mRNA interferase toxin, RelE/StbE family [bacterium]